MRGPAGTGTQKLSLSSGARGAHILAHAHAHTYTPHICGKCGALPPVCSGEKQQQAYDSGAGLPALPGIVGLARREPGSTSNLTVWKFPQAPQTPVI